MKVGIEDGWIGYNPFLMLNEKRIERPVPYSVPV